MIEFNIRKATRDDLTFVQEIYAHYVSNTVISFEETPPDLQDIEKRYHTVCEQNLPYLVAETVDKQVIGYAYALPYRPRKAYRYTLEESVYVHPEFSGKGIGRALLEELVQQTSAKDYKQMIAVITGKPKSPSYNFHQKSGFEMVGILKNVGYKHGQWLDTIFMQKELSHEQ